MDHEERIDDPGIQLITASNKPGEGLGADVVVGGQVLAGPGDNEVVDIAASLTPSDRGEYEINDVNRAELHSP